MALRTGSAAVEAILGKHYDPDVVLTGFMDTANLEVDWLKSQDSSGVLSEARLEMIERWLSAHFYAHADQLLKQEQAGGASGTYQGNTGMGFLSTQYGQSAVNLDLTGLLARKNSVTSPLGASKKASMVWLGDDFTDPLYPNSV